ncbi:MAG: ABC transporter ATP-binding protein [Clostridium celatum]|uniref:ABC transporter ATP-binding protein n=1 Tax=uncultured Clostridium sp. TaxID=59620 RepID=UPI0025FDD408|nr:ABC transporter ATP-binding protein [uncultured Clostridium sp.]MDU4883387.1 ABC transporter ATP-binding protein [Clostridium celatum]MDU5261509.1 ABC transporter ATP-binding protein [Clostridium celatum]MDU7076450.1 ABC transporter ATP-binding protein [Clostridium celatum]
MNSIEIRNLQKDYKNFSLTIDNLDIPEGYITGFIGPNGSGKTTTIKSLLGMVKTNSGEIKILNANINKDTKTKENIAYVGDESGFLEESKISNLHKIISKFYSNWDEELYKKYINKFQINESKLYKDLSKGQKKQFELIMALSHHPRLLIMDEPTSSLDPIIRNEFLDLMQDHMEMDNMTVFYSTHITTDLDKAADYIVMIYKGKILLKGEKDEILDNHVIVKIKKELVDSSIKREFISLKESAFGFEGLISDKRKAYDIFGDEAIYEKCTLEDILLYYTRRN